MLRASVLTAVAACPSITAAYADGAPPGHTGGFGEPNCATCHFAEPVHKSLGLDGLVADYQPGQTYRLQLRLQSAEAQVAGFQLTARFAKGGAQAGTFTPSDAQQLTNQQSVTYLSHDRRARPIKGGSAFMWSITWIAPAAINQPVIFHAAAVSGNDDESPLGDGVHLLETTLDSRP